jgi:anti-sigma B factor antagonist
MYPDSPLTFDRRPGKNPGTLVFRLAGPLILRNFFEFQAALREEPQPQTTILDLSDVPYMDSAGMGLIMNYYVHCQNRGAVLVVAGVSSRVLELFKLTKVDAVIPMKATVEEAEAGA